MSQKQLNSEELETRLQFYKLKAEHLEKQVKELKAKLDIDSFPEIPHRAVYEEVNGIELEKLDEFIYAISPYYTAVFQPCDKKTLNEIKKHIEELWQKETGLKLIHAYYMYVPDLCDEHVWRLLPRYYLVKGE